MQVIGPSKTWDVSSDCQLHLSKEQVRRLQSLLLSSSDNVEQKSMDFVVKFKKLSSDAIAPTQGSSGAAGFDLYASQYCIIPGATTGKGVNFIGNDFVVKTSQHLVKTDIAVKIPDTHYGRIAPRSGLALKSQIGVGAGVVDSDYRGEVGVLLINHGSKDFHIQKGDRIAQLIFEKCETKAKLVEVEDLDDTNRGSGGFGSTGTK